MNIPENYGGLAITEDGYIEEGVTEREAEAAPTLAVPCIPEREASGKDVATGERPHGAWLSDTFEGLCRRIGLHLPAFDREDILLIGVALFLFFSKDGDKECALLLIALLFLS